MNRFGPGGGAFAKPENALNRAEELIAIGQKQAALQALHDVITSKARSFLTLALAGTPVACVLRL
jgi:hypothetical protein